MTGPDLRAGADAPLVGSALATVPLVAFAAFLFLNDLWMSAELRQEWWWGGLQMWAFPVPLRVLAAVAAPLALLLPVAWFAASGRAGYRAVAALRLRLGHPALVVSLAILALWSIRSTALVIGDSTFYVTDLIPREAFSDRGLILNYDSIGTTLLYSRGYRFAHLFFGFDALTWYNVAGLCCLGASLLWLRSRARAGAELASPALLLLLFSGNWSQATLGAPEHYGQVLLCQLGFAIVAAEALRGRAPLWQPCAAYAIGAFFHLMIGWLLPALLYVLLRCWKRETPEGRQLALTALLLPAFLTGLLCYAYGFDVSFLTGTNSAEGKLIPFLDPSDPYSGDGYQYSTMDIRHLAHILQELVLMGWPGLIVLTAAAPHVSWRRIAGDPVVRFAALFFAGTFLLNLLWNPDLEMWRDQDLFSVVGLGACVLAAAVLSAAELTDAVRARILVAAIAAGMAWRVPVVLWHSVLSPQYYDSSIATWAWPF